MAIGSKKLFLFDLSPNEITKSLHTVVSHELDLLKTENLPVVYKNAMCISKNQFIHEYPDGRKYLIKQNQNTSEEIVIRQL